MSTRKALELDYSSAAKKAFISRLKDDKIYCKKCMKGFINERTKRCVNCDYDYSSRWENLLNDKIADLHLAIEELERKVEIKNQILLALILLPLVVIINIFTETKSYKYFEKIVGNVFFSGFIFVLIILIIIDWIKGVIRK